MRFSICQLQKDLWVPDQLCFYWAIPIQGLQEENEEKETQIMLKTSNLNLETKKVEGPEIEKRIKFTMTTGPIQV